MTKITKHAWRASVPVFRCLHKSAIAEAISPAAQLVERTFTFPGDACLPKATFDAWKKLADTFSVCGQLSRRQQLLLNPVTHAFKSDKRPSVHQVASDVMLTFPCATSGDCMWALHLPC